MGYWSTENATKAYLGTLKMGKQVMEPHVSEFISAIAAGNNAQLMIVVCTEMVARSAILIALVSAAHQTGGHVVCILKGIQELQSTKAELGLNHSEVEFVIGDSQRLIADDYKDADFIVVDCKLESHEMILHELTNRKSRNHGAIILGCNAFCSESLQWSVGRQKTQLLPIGEGLLVVRIASNSAKISQRKSNWIVRVDKNTGEEHVFRVPHRKDVLDH